MALPDWFRDRYLATSGYAIDPSATPEPTIGGARVVSWWQNPASYTWTFLTAAGRRHTIGEREMALYDSHDDDRKQIMARMSAQISALADISMRTGLSIDELLRVMKSLEFVLGDAPHPTEPEAPQEPLPQRAISLGRMG